jgi:cytochrome c-type biogenesis protein CcmH
LRLRKARKLAIFVGILLLYLFIFSNVVYGYSDEVNNLAGKLICTCGCDTMLVSDCDCEAAKQMKDFIQEKLDSGAKPSEVLDILVKTYGEKVLAEPRRKGFGLLAWVIPFLAVLSGLFLVFLLIRRWTKKKEVFEASDSASPYENEYRKKIEEELDKWT